MIRVGTIAVGSVWVVAWVAWVFASPVQTVNGQDLDGAATQQAPPDDVAGADQTPHLTAYLAIRTEMRQLDDQISRTLRTIPINNAAQRKSMLEAVEQMRARKQALSDSLPAAAVQAFLEAPDTNQIVTDHVVFLVRDALGETINAQRFDPQRGHELAKTLCASGTKNLGLYYLAGRAAYCLHEFDEAEASFRQLAELGATVPEETYQTLATQREAWQRELEQRAADEQAALPRVLLKTTAGDIVLELFEDQAPNTVARFIGLVEQKFYDGMIFYLHKPGQYSMSGCLRGDGTTAMEYFIPDEHQREDARKHFAGSVSLQTLEPDRGSCQFAIVHQPMEDRNGHCTVFGRVVEGLEVVFGMSPMEPQLRFSRPTTRITSATVLRKRTHAYEVEHKIPFDSRPLVPPPATEADQGGGGG